MTDGDHVSSISEETLEGKILVGETFDPVEGRLVVEAGDIVAIEEMETDSTDVILPAFVNAHTHIGDAIAKEAGRGLSLDELVAPPDGLKHRLLRAADPADLVGAMARTLRFMEQGGTSTFIEFREGDVEGVELLRDAMGDRSIDAVILGRGSEAAMEAADGFGASGARDGEFGRLRTATGRADKLFGIHAGERDAADINPALDLEPDFLVHMVYAESIHLDRIADTGTPVVVCPRSNLVTDVGLPDLDALAAHTTVALGTDNVMLNSPSMFREMEFAAKFSDLTAPEVLAMATVNGAAIAGLDRGVLEVGRPAKLLVLDGDSDNLAGAHDWVRAIVRRAGVADVSAVYL